MASAFNIYEQVINLDVLSELLVQQSNLYLQQNGRNFLIKVKGMKGFIVVNYIMAVNQLPSIPSLRGQNKTKQIRAIKLD